MAGGEKMEADIVSRDFWVRVVELKDGKLRIESDEGELKLEGVHKVVLVFPKSTGWLYNYLYLRDGEIAIYKWAKRIAWERQEDGEDWVYIYF